MYCTKNTVVQCSKVHLNMHYSAVYSAEAPPNLISGISLANVLISILAQTLHCAAIH